MAMRTTIILIIFISTASFLYLPVPITASLHNITAVFAFGDSTLDSGNNNYIGTLFRGDHPPYGRDLPNHIPSGRFSDGKLTTDFMVSSLGLKEFLPAYLDRSVADHDLLTGVSFASAGSGLDELTSTESHVLHILTQLQYFEQALQRIQRIVGPAEASRIVGNALFVIGAGTNDLLFNFYGLPTRRAQYSLPAYHDFLLRNLESVIRRLYSMGARRVSVAGLPPIGCLPMQVTVGSLIPSIHMLQRVCVDQQNIDSQAYNSKLQALTSRLQASLTGAKVAYVDIYNPIIDMIMNPSRYGLLQTLQGCCGTGLMEVGPLCNVISPTCLDPSRYLFWDSIHPTQAAYRILANIYEQTVLPRLVG